MTGATSTAFKLPKDLADLDLKFGRAFNTADREIWPEGDKFLKAEQPAAIAKVLIHSSPLHARLSGAKIAYLFRPEIVANGGERISASAKAGGKLCFLSGYDFTLEFNHKRWVLLRSEQRIAAVDHALCACAQDEETGAYGIRPFDVCEFSDVVGRWGLWTPPLKGFGVAIESAQIELFVPMGGTTPAEERAGTKATTDDLSRRRRKKKVEDDAGDFELDDDDD